MDRLVAHALAIPVSEVLILLVLYLQRDRGYKRRTASGITLRPLWFAIIGLVATALGTLITIASAHEPESQAALIEDLIIAQLFFLPGILLIYVGLIHYTYLPDGEDYFLYRTGWGRILHVRYDDCRGYKIEEDYSATSRRKYVMGVSVRATLDTRRGKKDKKLTVYICWNFDEFVEALKEHHVKKERNRKKK